MTTRGFYPVPETKNDPWWFHKPINELKTLAQPLEFNIIDANVSIRDALNKMRDNNVDCLLQIDDG